RTRPPRPQTGRAPEGRGPARGDALRWPAPRSGPTGGARGDRSRGQGCGRTGARARGSPTHCRAADERAIPWRVPEPALRRLETVPWNGLDGLVEVVLPAIARVLEGASAEREIDRLLRKHPALGPEQRTAVVEAIFGVGLWRRRDRKSTRLNSSH